MSSRRVVHVEHAPPENEVPVVLAPGISWGGVGVVFAIPALLLYSTGFELLIMFRVSEQRNLHNYTILGPVVIRSGRDPAG